MTGDAGHDPRADAAPPLAGEHEDVAHVGERGAVADDARESHLPAAVEGAEADRVADGALHDLAGNPGGPVGRPGKEVVDRVEVEPRGIGGDQDATVVPLVVHEAHAPFRAARGARSRRSRSRAAAGPGAATGGVRITTSEAAARTESTNSPTARSRAERRVSAGTKAPAGVVT